MGKYTSKRAAVVATAGLLVFGAAAVAYFSSTGSGNGTGAVTAGARTVTLSATQTGGDYTELGQARTFDILATNAGASEVKVNSITVTSVGGGATCPSGSFSAGTVSYEASTKVPANTSTPLKIASVPVTFNNVDGVQDTCVPTVNLSSN